MRVCIHYTYIQDICILKSYCAGYICHRKNLKWNSVAIEIKPKDRFKAL